jgi:hypothetical protein
MFCSGSNRVKNNGTQPLFFVCPLGHFFYINKPIFKALITHYKGIDWIIEMEWRGRGLK